MFNIIWVVALSYHLLAIICAPTFNFPTFLSALTTVNPNITHLILHYVNALKIHNNYSLLPLIFYEVAYKLSSK